MTPEILTQVEGPWRCPVLSKAQVSGGMIALCVSSRPANRRPSLCTAVGRSGCMPTPGPLHPPFRGKNTLLTYSWLLSSSISTEMLLP